MFSKTMLRKIAVYALFCFVFLIGTSEYSFATEEDILLKARKYYQEGNYDESVKVLQKFIENLRAIVEQKRNVAEAFYLLAKVYYTVGEDSEVDKNLKKVFETFPAFAKNETDLEFQKRVQKVRSEMGLKEVTATTPQIEQTKPVKKVIKKEGKKKKKFPILLVLGGVAVVAVILLLVLKKKKEDDYDIRGAWRITQRVTILGENIVDNVRYEFNGSKTSGNFVDQYDDRGTYTVNGKSVTLNYTTANWNFTGNFDSADSMSGTFVITGQIGSFNGTWNGIRLSGESEVQRSAQSGSPISKKVDNK